MMLRCFDAVALLVFFLLDCLLNNTSVSFPKGIHVFCCFPSSITITFAAMSDIHCPGRVAQSVTCLPTDASLTADPGVAISIPARCHTFVEIDYEMISTVVNHSRRIVVNYKRKYVHEVLFNCLFKLAQETVWLSEHYR